MVNKRMKEILKGKPGRSVWILATQNTYGYTDNDDMDVVETEPERILEIFSSRIRGLKYAEINNLRLKYYEISGDYRDTYDDEYSYRLTVKNSVSFVGGEW